MWRTNIGQITLEMRNAARITPISTEVAVAAASTTEPVTVAAGTAAMRPAVNAVPTEKRRSGVPWAVFACRGV